MASGMFISAWMTALFLLMLVYATQGAGNCDCKWMAAFQQTCPSMKLNGCDRTAVQKNLRNCRVNCGTGKRSSIDSLLNFNTQDDLQNRDVKRNGVAASNDLANLADGGWAAAITSNQQCLLDEIFATLPAYWKDQIIEIFDVAMSTNNHQ